MKNKILTWGIACCAALAIFSCNKKEETVSKEVAAATVDANKIKAEIQALENTYADAVNAGNADDVVVYYSSDAISYSQNKRPAEGQAAIKSMIEEDIQTSKGTKVSYTTNEVHPSSDGNMVVELGSYKVVDATNAPKASGNYMAVFQNIDGKYVCVRDMSASDMPKEEKK